MRLFNKSHFPVLDEGVHFNFCYALPSEDTFSVTIKEHSIKIEPTTKHDKVFLTDLTDNEKKKLFDLVVNVDDIRLLGHTIQMLLSLKEDTPFLHDCTIDGKMASKKTRSLICNQCHLKDSILVYDKTLTEFLKTAKISYNDYEAVDCSNYKPYLFSTQDIANYSRALQNTTQVNYEVKETPAKDKDTKEKYTFKATWSPTEEEEDEDLSLGDIIFHNMRELWDIFNRL